MAANAVTKSAAGLSRETSALASATSVPTSVTPARSTVLLQSALLTAMKMLAGNPFPETVSYTHLTLPTN